MYSVLQYSNSYSTYIKYLNNGWDVELPIVQQEV